MNRHRAFTLLEMLLATMLSVILIGGVLAMSAALARDQKRLSSRPQSNADGVIELIRFDLANARTMTQSADGQNVIFIGHGGLDRRSFAATNRLTRVIYRVDPDHGVLTRRQEYLDDPARPQKWEELLATGVARIDVIAASNDGEPVRERAVSAALLGARRIGDVKIVPADMPLSITVPSRVHVRIASATSPVDREIWVR
jgi:hypothetical protein